MTSASFTNLPPITHAARSASSSRPPAARSNGSIAIWICECLRRVADLTLRSYAQHLLHFLRWWESVHHTDAIAEEALTESTLLDYVRFQSGQQPPFSGSTINQRVAVADRALRAAFPDAPAIAPAFRSATGAVRPWALADHCPQ